MAMTVITAADLKPGDIVCNEAGERSYAAFDVSHEDGLAFIWTAIRDQEEAGQPNLIVRPHSDALTVQRRG